MYYRNAAAAILVVDVTQANSLSVADRWILDIRQKTEGTDCYIILAVNKIDLPNRSISTEEVSAFCEEKGIESIETSALSGYQVDELFDKVCENCTSNSSCYFVPVLPIDSVAKPENIIQCIEPVHDVGKKSKGCCQFAP